MKIAFIGQKGAPTRNGGVERYAENLAANLVAQGHEVLLYSRKYYCQGIREYKGIRIITVPSLNTKSLEAITHTFFACLDVSFRKVDIINVQSIGPASLIWLLKILNPLTPVVFTFHCQDYYQKKWGAFARWYLRLGEKMGCSLADRIITISKDLTAYVERTYHKTATYIPNGTQIASGPLASPDIRRWGLERNNYISYIGRLIPHKNVHHLISAFKKVKTDKRLVIVGASSYTDNYVQKLNRLAEGDERIIFVGNQEGLILKALFSNSYLFVQPSEYEGLSVALLEAMGWGLACLVSDIPQNLEAIQDAGLSFQVNDTDDLAKKLQYLLDNPEETARLGSLAIKRARNEYNWQGISEQVARVYKDLINEYADKYARRNSSPIF